MTESSTDHGGSGTPQSIPPGRPIRLESTPRGLWRAVFGGGVAALAPMFGFLIGGAIEAPRDGANDPMFVALFIGIIVGGLGVLVAVNGGIQLWRTSRDKDLAEEAEEAGEAQVAEVGVPDDTTAP